MALRKINIKKSSYYIADPYSHWMAQFSVTPQMLLARTCYLHVACVPVAGCLQAMGVRVTVPALPAGQRRAGQAVSQRLSAGGAALSLLLARRPFSFLPHTVRRRACLPVPRCVHSPHCYSSILECSTSVTNIETSKQRYLVSLFPWSRSTGLWRYVLFVSEGIIASVVRAEEPGRKCPEYGGRRSLRNSEKHLHDSEDHNRETIYITKFKIKES